MHEPWRQDKDHTSFFGFVMKVIKTLGDLLFQQAPTKSIHVIWHVAPYLTAPSIYTRPWFSLFQGYHVDLGRHFYNRWLQLGMIAPRLRLSHTSAIPSIIRQCNYSPSSIASTSRLRLKHHYSVIATFRYLVEPRWRTLYCCQGFGMSFVYVSFQKHGSPNGSGWFIGMIRHVPLHRLNPFLSLSKVFNDQRVAWIIGTYYWKVEWTIGS